MLLLGQRNVIKKMSKISWGEEGIMSIGTWYSHKNIYWLLLFLLWRSVKSDEDYKRQAQSLYFYR